MTLDMIGLGRMNTRMVRCRGSVIASWLPELVVMGLLDSPELAHRAPAWSRTRVKGAGRSWLASTPQSNPSALSAARYERLPLCGEDDYTDKVLSALCYACGGREEKAAAAQGDA